MIQPLQPEIPGLGQHRDSPIVEEIRAIRAKLLAEFDNDLDRYVAHLQERQKHWKGRIVSRQRSATLGSATDELEVVYRALESRLKPNWSNHSATTRDNTVAFRGALRDMASFLASRNGSSAVDVFPENPETSEGERGFDGAIITTDDQPILLAEFEQGKWGSSCASHQMCVGDFLKLLKRRSPLKLMIYRGPDDTCLSSIRAEFNSLLNSDENADPSSRWLLVGLVHTAHGGEWAPQVHVSQGAKPHITLGVPDWKENLSRHVA